MSPFNPFENGVSIEIEDLVERRKALVRQTWRSIEFAKDSKFTAAFYERLFQKYPEVIPMFSKISLEAQAMKLYEVVSVAVRCLDDLDGLVPVLQDLGARHASAYGVQRGHYGVVTEIFVEVLYDFLYSWWPKESTGSTSVFLLDVTDAWSWVLNLIGEVMADAGDEAMAAKTPEKVSAVI
mmetsp:Transcript_5761/g.12153  ORF Transcript_5761/g.12153 Transcript_5761/m.12153 type:complete len:181 (-) Transcript_5761:207-749(-)|eukprot:CAMPEP_0172440420 /NCGR_PEP_ID=MMETSP1065-20121228/1041_1 /TAXON_ID=265537 /ORGANISM="Amphiprora paludosa, Strain CCMP125" /LENGTH=180 /DNA_ID=CAMNT_0013189233 /DNA_START=76 /DNA_END=618 /DNA_ORIENTATION=+